MRDWRNRQTRTFKGRVGDRVSSSLTSRTKIKTTDETVVFCFGATSAEGGWTSQDVDVRRRLFSRAVANGERHAASVKSKVHLLLRNLILARQHI